MREEIKKELDKRNIFYEETSVKKNGIKKEGLVIGNESIRPTIYWENIVYYGNSVEEIVDKILELSNEQKMDHLKKDLLLDWNWVKNHIVVCIQKNTNSDSVYMKFLDMIVYIRILFSYEDSYTSCVVTHNLLKIWDISINELFRTAWINTKDTFRIYNMVDTILQMMGADISDDLHDEIVGYDFDMYILTNQIKYFGAAAILNREFLNSVCDNLNTEEIMILPSSIHEIIITKNENYSLDEMKDMVISVNSECLPDEDILSDHVYIYNRNEEEFYY